MFQAIKVMTCLLSLSMSVSRSIVYHTFVRIEMIITMFKMLNIKFSWIRVRRHSGKLGEMTVTPCSRSLSFLRPDDVVIHALVLKSIPNLLSL